jgi:glycosyltransferase involved in cell wall biosynthesis
MKHILILSLNNDPSSFPGSEHAGGQTKYILELPKNFLVSGYSVEIITIGPAGQAKREEFVPGAFVTRFYRKIGEPYGYDIESYEIDDISRQIATHIKVDHPDINLVLCCYWVSGRAGTLVRDELQCPLVVTFCSLAGFKRTADSSYEVETRFKEEMALGQKADAVIATNKPELKILVSEYQLPQEKVHLIPRGIDLSVFHP